MKLVSITATSLAIPFNVAFRHASAERSTTQSLWVEARAQDGTPGYGEGCPREYVTSESIASAQAFVHAYIAELIETIRDTDTLADWVARHRDVIDANPAAWTAVELALLDLLGKCERQSVESLLGLPELSGRFCYTAVLGDSAPAQFSAQLAHYRKAGFSAFKIKLSGDRDRDAAKVAALTAAGVEAQAVRADANNLWQDADTAIRTLEALGYSFFALEEPLRAGDYEGMTRLAAALETRIILDESLLRADQLDRLPGPAERWIANLRISKMGGVLRSLDLVRALRSRELAAHHRRACRRNERAYARGAYRRAQCARYPHCAGGRFRHASPCARRRRAAAHVGPGRDTRQLGDEFERVGFRSGDRTHPRRKYSKKPPLPFVLSPSPSLRTGCVKRSRNMNG